MSDGIRRIGNADEGLTAAQETALAILREGGSFVAAAREAGVGRATVYRWVQSNPHFQAAYNLWQRELAESARARLLNLTDKAVEVIEKALKRDDEKVALKMLRHTGVLRRRRAGSTDVEVLDLQNQLRHRQAHRRAATGMIHSILGNAGFSRKQRQRIINGQDRAEFQGELRERLEPADEPKTGTNNETPAPQEPAAPIDAHAAGEGDSMPKPLPEQEMSEQSEPPALGLAGETGGETPTPVSRDSEPVGESQMIEGWRVGMQLHAVP